MSEFDYTPESSPFVMSEESYRLPEKEQWSIGVKLGVAVVVIGVILLILLWAGVFDKSPESAIQSAAEIQEKQAIAAAAAAVEAQRVIDEAAVAAVEAQRVIDEATAAAVEAQRFIDAENDAAIAAQLEQERLARIAQVEADQLAAVIDPTSTQVIYNQPIAMRW